MFARKRPLPAPRLPEGQRVYAIGDIHGELALLRALLAQVVADNRDREPAHTTLIFLGDFIDRGSGSALLLQTFADLNDPNVVMLKGNHEATLVDVYRGDREALPFWVRYGGLATMLGLGIDPGLIDTASADVLLQQLREAVPGTIIDWLAALPHSWTLGDYLFVHAGIRPGVRLSKQDPDDLLWIRKPFLKSRRRHEKIVVHGHSVEAGAPQLGGNRIGIDTGAHEHGCLTALGLEGDRQWLLQSVAEAPAT